MGFFKDVRKLQKQGKEIDKNFDPGAQMADAKSRMADAMQTMQDQTKAANLAATGVDATATIGAIRQTGQMINFQPMCEIDLMIMGEGPPRPVTVSQVVQQVQIPMIQPGKTLHVKVDPNDPQSVWIDMTSAV
jgi:hypothetical protein